ncbi:serine/arginine-rich splicing factor 4-like [Macrosteles quadrilineatus]|uniref:serine/arginine-rich splicing factor 4-like n=1 Tax=Macrosteles quadrilineatus TaxID=74068 RepID=UPI0023E2367F|nr:serine/arginine-rich splicing factor 4-like [Macrosteles quadrilineatus]
MDIVRRGDRTFGRSSRHSSSWYDKYGRPTRTEYRLMVKNLSSSVSWQDLKDYMRQAGKVTYADAHKGLRNKGFVEFATYSDMKNALYKLDDTEINGRRIRLVEDRQGDGRCSRSSSSRSRSRSRSFRTRSRSCSQRSSRSRSRRSSRSKSESRSRSRSISRGKDRSKSKYKSCSRSESKKQSRSKSRSQSVSKGKPNERSRSPSKEKSKSKSRSPQKNGDRSPEVQDN